MDPYAKVVGRTMNWHESLFGFRATEDDTTFNTRDSAAHAPLAAVVDTAFTWGDDRPARTPWHETVWAWTSEESLVASDVIANLGQAFNELRSPPV